jgi:hypothetical protein
MPTKTGYAVATLADLKAIDSTTRVNGYIRSVTNLYSWFIFIAAATDTADDINIIAPNTGTGRWFKTKAFSLPTDIPGLVEYIQDTIYSSTPHLGDLTFTYNDTSNNVTVNINSLAINNSHISNTANIAQGKILNLVADLADKASTNHTHVSSQIVDFSEAVDDRVASLVTCSDGTITFTYNDTTNTLDIKAIAAATNIPVRKDGSTIVSASAINFTGAAVSVTNSGTVANIDISAASSVASQIFTVSTGTLAAGAFQIVSFTATPVGMFTNISSDFPARLKVFLTNAYAVADNGRPVNIELTGEHGCFLEAVTIPANLNLDLSPPASYYATVVGNLLYMSITNNDTVSRTITVTLTAFKW